MNSTHNSMLKYQNDFAIEFAKLMQVKLPAWKKIQSEQRKGLYSLPSIGWYFVMFLLGFVPGKHEHNYDIKCHFWFAVVLFIGTIIWNIQISNKSYQNSVKRTCFKDLLNIFDKSIVYGRWNLIPINDYQCSELISPNKAQTQEVDDCFYGTFKDVDFKINETKVGYNRKTKNNDNIFEPVFKGVSMHFKLHKVIKSRVLILSKYSWTKIPKDYERVNVEYEKFNKHYEVWVPKDGDGQIEARYLLNTAFLDRFMQLKTSFRVRKMCCSVYGGNMLIMLSTRRDLFEFNHLFGKIDDPKQYKTLFEEFASVLSFIDVLNLSSKTKL